jgi:hypothetical protein
LEEKNMDLSSMNWKLVTTIAQTAIAVLGAVAGIAVAFSAIARCIEAWYQLSQTPGLSSWAKITQWWKNFWSVEKYKTKKEELK